MYVFGSGLGVVCKWGGTFYPTILPGVPFQLCVCAWVYGHWVVFSRFSRHSSNGTSFRKPSFHLG